MPRPVPSSGGKKPSRPSGGRLVFGSIDWNVAVSSPVCALSESWIRTLKVSPFWNIATVVWKCSLPSGIAISVSPKPASVHWKVDQSRLGSSWSVTTTPCAGDVAEGSFSKSMR